LFTVFSRAIHPPPSSTLFPYTTLFRSRAACRRSLRAATRRDSRTRRETGRTCYIRPTASAPQARDPDRRRQGSVRMRRSCRNIRSEEHTSELQSQSNLVCRLLLEKKNL